MDGIGAVYLICESSFPNFLLISTEKETSYANTHFILVINVFLFHLFSLLPIFKLHLFEVIISVCVNQEWGSFQSIPIFFLFVCFDSFSCIYGIIIN